ncbi:Rap1a/Tai family immunity protein [Caulobacter sp. KR2-114]|uniref:Rap1a/Tai family immunity protein n=1 Tax=Caulobacter sp. KR2-114 TaxID=3400912 RepID=UPI003C0AA192
MRRMVLALAAGSVAAGAVLAGVSAAAAPSDREFFTGEALYQRCAAGPADPDFAARKAACRGYVLGVSDTLQAGQGTAPIAGPPRAAAVCLPDIDADQMVETVSRYLTDHAENRRYAGPDVVYMALKAAYPCA